MDSESSASRRNWVGLVVISVAVSLIIVDSTIVNVAVPSVVRDLRISSTQVQWVQESYTLVFASLLLVFGTLADRFGRRRMLIVGTAIFALSSIAAALSPTGDLLILSRVVQGVGGAMILPTTLSLINATFRGRDRGVAFAVWGSTIGGMAALGPLLGGWLTTDFSWRWAFAINLPLGVLIILGTVLFVQESRATEKRSIDVPGAVLSVVLFAGLVFGLIEGRTLGWWTTASKLTVGSFRWPWSLSPIPLAFGIALLALVAFILRARVRQRSGRASMLDLELLSIRSFRNGNVAAMIVSLGEFGVILSLPLWLQNVLGYSALQTGFTLLSLAIGSFVASGFGATAGQRFAPLWIVRAGILFEIAGLLVVALVIGTSTQWWQIAIGLFVYGFGVGLATAQLTGVILADVPTELSGQASGTQSTSRQIGSALGIAILGTVLFSSLGTGLSHRLSTVAAGQRTGIVDSVVSSSGTIIPSLARISYAVQVQAEQAFSDSTRWAALTAAGFLLLGLAATASLRQRRS